MRRLLLALLLALLASPSWSQASRLFNGTDDTITMGDVLDFERTVPFSVVFHYRASGTSPTTDQAIVSKLQNAGSFLGWEIEASGVTAGDPFRFYLRSGTLDRIHVTFPRVNDTLWHHVGCSYDGGSLAAGVLCYVDGVLQTNTVEQNDMNANSTLHTGPLRLGARGVTAANFCACNIAHVSVYNVVLRAQEIQELRFAPFSVVRGRVGCWALWDNAADATFQDCSRNGLNGTAANDPDVSSDGPTVFIPGGGQ